MKSDMIFFYPQDYDDHIEEISHKLVTISDNMAEAQLSKVDYLDK